MRKSKTITVKVRGIDLDWMEHAMEQDGMDEEDLFSCLIRMSAPIFFDSEALTDEQVGHQVRKAHDMFLEFREITV